MKLKLKDRKTAVVAYCAYMNQYDAHKQAMALAVECLRITFEGKDEAFDAKEAGTQVVRDLMQTGLLRLPVGKLERLQRGDPE